MARFRRPARPKLPALNLARFVPSRGHTNGSSAKSKSGEGSSARQSLRPGVHGWTPTIPALGLKGTPPGGKRAAKSASAGAAAGKKSSQEPEVDRELQLARDRLLERFTIMQADLGGAFYEMAIRNHVKLDVLTRQAAELQRVDVELEEVEEKLQLSRADVAGSCPSCDAETGPEAVFCSRCGHELAKARDEPKEPKDA